MSLGNSNSTGCGIGILASAGTPVVEVQVFGNTATGGATFVSNRITAVNVSSTNQFVAAAATTGMVHMYGAVVATASGACTITLGIRPLTSSTITAYTNCYLNAMKST
jgi:hypothetical protein